MNIKIHFCLVALVAMSIFSPVSANAGQAKSSKPAAGGKKVRRRIADPITIEHNIFNHLGLNSQQKRETDRLLVNLKSEVDRIQGKGLVPVDRKVAAKQLQATKKEYQTGIKKTLTAAQLAKYMDIHKKIEYEMANLQRRRKPGMHF